MNGLPCTEPMKRLFQITCLFAGISLFGCSPNVDPVIAKGFSALDGAYASDVKPGDAAYTNCTRGEVNSRHVALCGISYGGTELAQVGAWEIVSVDGKFSVYAMNGKALQALDKMTRSGSLTATAYPGAFNPGTTRPVLDVAEVKEKLSRK